MFQGGKKKEIPSEIYDKNYLLSPYLEGFDSFQKSQLSVVKANELNLLDLSQGITVLDVGMGRGELLFHCARKGAIVFGVDYSQDAVAIARETMRQFPQADLRIADCRHLPFDDCYFDRVVSGDVIEHLCFEDGVVMLKEMRRVLRPGGFLLVHTTPNTFFTRVIFPLGKYFLKLINRQMVEDIDYAIRAISPKFHIHEYNLFSLKKAARLADLNHAQVWVSDDILRSGQHRYTKDFAGNCLIKFVASLGKFFLIRLFLSNDLYIKYQKHE